MLYKFEDQVPIEKEEIADSLGPVQLLSLTLGISAAADHRSPLAYIYTCPVITDLTPTTSSAFEPRFPKIENCGFRQISGGGGGEMVETR